MGQNDEDKEVVLDAIVNDIAKKSYAK